MRDVIRSLRAHKITDLQTWIGRLAIWTAAVGTGLTVVAFAYLSEHAAKLFFKLQAAAWWSPFVLTPLIGMLVVWATRRWFPGAAGSGIPQTIASLRTNPTEQVDTGLISLKTAFAKIALGLAALFGGFSTGREGPSVQVGASVMYSFRKLLPHGFVINQHNLILAGGAAGIAGAFNTPLAGIVFAIEELSRRYETKTNGILISAIVLAGLVAISLQGNYTYFGRLAVGDVSSRIFLPVLVCGLICGVAGGIFSRLILNTTKPATGIFGYFQKLNPIVRAGLCGLLIALLGWLSEGSAHGSGYFYTRSMLEGMVDAPWYYAPLKYMATLLSYFSGVPGGIFAPSLAVGAGIGHDLMPLFSAQVLPHAIYALCMAGFLAAVTQAPLTTFIIVMEMIDGHQMVLSLMAVTMIASLVARVFSPALYSALADRQFVLK